MEKFELDGIYFRVCRDDKWQDICLTDLTQREFEEVVGPHRPASWYRSAWEHLMDCWNYICQSCLSEEESETYTRYLKANVTDSADIGYEDLRLTALYIHTLASRLGIRRAPEDE